MRGIYRQADVDGIPAASACERNFALMLADDFMAGLEADPGAMDLMVLRFYNIRDIHQQPAVFNPIRNSDGRRCIGILRDVGEKIIEYPPEGDQVKIHAERDGDGSHATWKP